jgi:hypothetical protein
MQEDRFRQALQALGDSRRTTIIVVTGADRGAIREAARTSGELDALNLSNQILAVNGRFHATDPTDVVAVALERDQDEALAATPASLTKLPRDEIPLVGFDIVGLAALGALLSSTNPPPIVTSHQTAEPVESPYRYPADATTGSHPHKGDLGDPAGDNSGFRGRSSSGGPAAGRHRAIRLGHQQMPYRLGNSRPLAAIAA